MIKKKKNSMRINYDYTCSIPSLDSLLPELSYRSAIILLLFQTTKFKCTKIKNKIKILELFRYDLNYGVNI